MTNNEFRTKFDECLVGDTHQKIDNIRELIKEASSDLSKKSILTSNDFYDMSKRKLEDIISDLVYKSQNGSFILIDNRIDYYRYNDGWVDTGYMYNVAKNSMSARDIFGGANNRDCYLNIKYMLDHSRINSIDLLY